MDFLFERLEAYQLSIELLEEVDLFIKSTYKRWSYISDQLGRAALSISTNITEGNGRGKSHIKDKNKFLYIARGSAFECVPIIELCYKKGDMSHEKYNNLRRKLISISKMLSAMIRE